MKHLFEKHLRLAQNIRCLMCDVDGVMTDGKLHYDAHGESTKVFDVQDGMGLTLLMQSGIHVAVISGRQCAALEKRLDELGITDRILGQHHKLPAFESLLKKNKFTAEQVAYIGDDLNDLCIMQRVGLAIAPANAAAHIKHISHLVTPQPGGHGAVRSVCEGLLHAHQLWDHLLKEIA